MFTQFFEEARIGMFTKEERFAYEESRKHLWDNYSTLTFAYDKGEKSGIVKGKEIGLAEGKELGIEETKKEDARKMLAAGMTKEAILEMMGWSEDVFRRDVPE